MPVEGIEVRQPLTTARLLLRAYEPGDLDSLLALHGDPERLRWVPFEPRSREEAKQVLERKIEQIVIDAPGEHSGIALVIAERASGEFVGELTLSYSSRKHSTAELGFMLLRGAEGRGFATEGAREMLRIGFEELGFHRIVARVYSTNSGSAAVLERLGMRHEAHLVDNEVLRGEWTSEDAFAMLEREWRGGRGRP